jgi:hypothetical protein
MVELSMGKPVLTADGIPVHCAHDAILPLGEFRENPNNGNKHPQHQLELLTKIILKTGWRRAITVSRRSGLMTIGHGRLYSARLGNMTEAPVDFQDYVDEAEEIADLVADNRIPELAEMDYTKLGDNLRFLEAEGRDLEIAGFDAINVSQILGAGPAMSPGDFMVGDEGLAPGDPGELGSGPQGPDLERITLLVDPLIREQVLRSVEYIGREFDRESFKIVG